MKVVLVKDVEKIGNRGDVVEVATGYGVNGLIPKGFALKATVDAINRAKTASAQRKAKATKVQTQIASLGDKVDKKKLQIRVKASKSGRLYGSLAKPELTAIIAKEWGLEGSGAEVSVDLAQPIRDAGRYPLSVKVSTDATEKSHEIILSVVAE